MLNKILLAAAALGISSAALAHDGPARAWGHYKHHPRMHAPRPVVVVPAPRVVYAPPPRVAYRYYAAPVVRAVPVRPAPVYSAPSFSIRFDIPL